MSPMVLSSIIGVAVITLVGGLSLVFMKPASWAEQRLDDLVGKRKKGKTATASANLMRAPAIDMGKSQSWFKSLRGFSGLSRLYEQADVGLPFRFFLAIAISLSVIGAGVGYFLKVPLMYVPIGAGSLGLMPFFWLVLRKKKRIKAFVSQMPEALELVGRALRAGHGLASGLGMVAEEMPPPISHEFGRIYEEQNLGLPIEEALRGLSDRVPVMDVRFFVTAVVVQRSAGGDLAEVLDKIGRLIRERFQILGQVQSLTAEGRLSGVVLLAMPPSLLAFCYSSNPEYISLLFTTPVGVKMLVVAGVLQVVGALAIKKIVTIKV
jgi:tight adherence protein B